MNIFDRLKEIAPRPKSIRGCSGLYKNMEQFRVELIVSANLISDAVTCWVTIEQLIHMAKMPELRLKKIIQVTPGPLQSLYIRFFFPESVIMHYLNTGKRLELFP